MKRCFIFDNASSIWGVLICAKLNWPRLIYVSWGLQVVQVLNLNRSECAVLLKKKKKSERSLEVSRLVHLELSPGAKNYGPNFWWQFMESRGEGGEGGGENMDSARWLWKKNPGFRKQVHEEASPYLVLGAQDKLLGAEQDQLPCGSKGTSSSNCQEMETRMVRTCHTPWQPLQNHPSRHLERWATPWSEEEMLDGQH